jgi:hypothetical protein
MQQFRRAEQQGPSGDHDSSPVAADAAAVDGGEAKQG